MSRILIRVQRLDTFPPQSILLVIEDGFIRRERQPSAGAREYVDIPGTFDPGGMEHDSVRIEVVGNDE